MSSFPASTQQYPQQYPQLSSTHPSNSSSTHSSNPSNNPSSTHPSNPSSSHSSNLPIKEKSMSIWWYVAVSLFFIIGLIAYAIYIYIAFEQNTGMFAVYNEGPTPDSELYIPDQFKQVEMTDEEKAKAEENKKIIICNACKSLVATNTAADVKFCTEYNKTC